ncbi:helicase-related protein [Bdellovibrionota bacterium FG-1]
MQFDKIHSQQKQGGTDQEHEEQNTRIDRKARAQLEMFLRRYVSRIPESDAREHHFWYVGVDPNTPIKNTRTAPRIPVPSKQMDTIFSPGPDLFSKDHFKAGIEVLLQSDQVQRDDTQRSLELVSGRHADPIKVRDAKAIAIMQTEAVIENLTKKMGQKKPRYKLLIFCQRKNAAKAFRTEFIAKQGKKGQKTKRRSHVGLGPDIKRQLLKFSLELCRQDRQLFPNGKPTNPTPVLVDEVRSRLGEDVALLLARKKTSLRERDPLLFVSAQLAAKRAKGLRAKATAFTATLYSKLGFTKDQSDSKVVRLLSRRSDLRRATLEKLQSLDSGQRCYQNLLALSKISIRKNRKRTFPYGPYIFQHPKILETLLANPFARAVRKFVVQMDEIPNPKTKNSEEAGVRLKLGALIAEAIHSDQAALSAIRRLGRNKTSIKHFCVEHKSLTLVKARRSREVEFLTGDNSDRRESVIEDFLSPGNSMVLVLTKVCSMGIDLHHFCWDVMHVSPEWTPHFHEQRTGRIDRPRPKELHGLLPIAPYCNWSQIRVHHLIWPYSYDERVFRRLNNRAEYADCLLPKKLEGNQEEQDRKARLLRTLTLDLQPKSNKRVKRGQ